MRLTKRDWLILIGITLIQAILLNLDTIVPLTKRGFLLSPPKNFSECQAAGGLLSNAQQKCTFGILTFNK